MTNLNYVKSGDYYIPDIKLKEENSYGKYGRLREKFLKQHLNSIYTTMLLTETLNEHLCEIDTEAKRQVEQIISQKVCGEGVSEDMKLNNQLEWVQKMNSIRNQAEEIVLQGFVYSMEV